MFGVYGILGIGLMLVCLRAMDTRAEWKEGWLKLALWGMNCGLLIRAAAGEATPSDISVA